MLCDRRRTLAGTFSQLSRRLALNERRHYLQSSRLPLLKAKRDPRQTDGKTGKRKKERKTDREDQRLISFFLSFPLFLAPHPTDSPAPPPLPARPPPLHPHGPSALNVKEQSAGETDSRRRCEWDD